MARPESCRVKLHLQPYNSSVVKDSLWLSINFLADTTVKMVRKSISKRLGVKLGKSTRLYLQGITVPEWETTSLIFKDNDDLTIRYKEVNEVPSDNEEVAAQAKTLHYRVKTQATTKITENGLCVENPPTVNDVPAVPIICSSPTQAKESRKILSSHQDVVTVSKQHNQKSPVRVESMESDSDAAVEVCSSRKRLRSPTLTPAEAKLIEEMNSLPKPKRMRKRKRKKSSQPANAVAERDKVSAVTPATPEPINCSFQGVKTMFDSDDDSGTRNRQPSTSTYHTEAGYPEDRSLLPATQPAPWQTSGQTGYSLDIEPPQTQSNGQARPGSCQSLIREGTATSEPTTACEDIDPCRDDPVSNNLMSPSQEPQVEESYSEIEVKPLVAAEYHNYPTPSPKTHQPVRGSGHGAKAANKPSAGPSPVIYKRQRRKTQPDSQASPCLGNGPGVVPSPAVPEAESKDTDLIPIESYHPMKGLPSVGDEVAFKRLELTENYSPELSDFKRGVVLSCDRKSSLLTVKLHSVSTKGKRGGNGVFDVLIEKEGELLTNVAPEEDVVTDVLGSFVDLRRKDI